MAVEWDEKCVDIAKSKTGIDGLDQITGDGLPKMGATLVAGNVGWGKTLFAMQFLVNGALLENEPGVFLALEESNEELMRNFASIGIDIQSLIDRGLLTLLNVDINQDFMEEPTKSDMGDWSPKWKSPHSLIPGCFWGDREVADERCHTLLIFKSRGIAHSKRACEFLLTDNGIRLKSLALGMTEKCLEKGR
jgi:KaiC